MQNERGRRVQARVEAIFEAYIQQAIESRGM